MTTDPSKILEISESLAKRNIDEAFAKVELSLEDYKGIFEAPLWTQDFGYRWSDLANGSLALDLEDWRHFHKQWDHTRACSLSPS